MFKHLYFGSVVLCILFSCTKGKADQTSNENKKDTLQQTVVVPKDVIITCKDRGADQYDVPINEVVLSVDGKQQIIDTIRTSCDIIMPVEYKSYQIPTDAKSACGGWWAGGGDYFYAIIKDNKVKVFHGWQDEGQDDEGYHWEEMPIK